MSPSIQMMGFFMSDINFCNTKEQLNHLGEVVTGKVDGSPTGDDISTSTLPYTGQVRKTLPALEDEYEKSITDKEAEADAAIDEYRQTNKGDYAAGITLENKFEFITYSGESYFATNPPYTTTATTPDVDGNLFVGGYVNNALLNESIPKYTSISFDDIQSLISGKSVNSQIVDLKDGDYAEVLGGDAVDDGYSRKFIIKTSASGGIPLANGRFAVLLNDAPKEKWDSENSRYNDIDVFVVYGQSNARGSTPIASSTPFVLPSGWGLKWNWQTSSIDELQDPCAKDGGSDVSAWPAFADQWTRLTGRKCLIVNAAVGGATIFKLNPTAPEGWFDDMTVATDSAISAALAQGYRINSVQMLWSQGEADAKNQTNIAVYEGLQDDIEAAFTAKYFGQGYRYGGMYISTLGFDWSSQDASDYDWTLKIGFKQTSATVNKTNQTPVFDGAQSFTRTNRMMHTDDIHYSHLGYNLMGETMANNIWRSVYKGDDIKGEIIRDALSYKGVQFVEPIQSNSGVESPISCIFKIKEYALDEGAPLAEVYGNLIRMLRGELVNPNGFGVKWDFDATTGNRLNIQNGNGTIQLKFLNGGIQTQNSLGVAQHTLYPDGRVQFHNLPNSSVGLGSGELWYNPADGNSLRYKA